MHTQSKSDSKRCFGSRFGFTTAVVTPHHGGGRVILILLFFKRGGAGSRYTVTCRSPSPGSLSTRVPGYAYLCTDIIITVRVCIRA
eukprot:1445142-Rhodomonas_salina.2